MPLASEPSAPATPASAVAEVGPRVYGVVDVVRPDRIAGWAIDRADSAAAVDVDIRREGRLVATVRADRPRRDLEKGGVGTGRYGFAASSTRRSSPASSSPCRRSPAPPTASAPS